MGQLQTNCHSFCKDLFEDDGYARIKARDQKKKHKHKIVKRGPISIKETDFDLVPQLVSVKKLSTEYAIAEDEDEYSYESIGPESLKTADTSLGRSEDQVRVFVKTPKIKSNVDPALVKELEKRKLIKSKKSSGCTTNSLGLQNIVVSSLDEEKSSQGKTLVNYKLKMKNLPSAGTMVDLEDSKSRLEKKLKKLQKGEKALPPQPKTKPKTKKTKKRKKTDQNNVMAIRMC